jgi:hypothetical protein
MLLAMVELISQNMIHGNIHHRNTSNMEKLGALYSNVKMFRQLMKLTFLTATLKYQILKELFYKLELSMTV